MPHKADSSFFDGKKEWSKRKDLILAYYLRPYLAKVAKLRRPVCVIDCFAGAGKFLSGEDGSPIIVANAIKEAQKRPTVQMSALCIEADAELYARLQTAVIAYDFVQTRHGNFIDQIPEIDEIVAKCTSFLYVDPYAIEGLDWEAMSRLFDHLRSNRSVEILLNFSATSFTRRAMAAIKLSVPSDVEDTDGSGEPPSVQRLNNAVGGDWWERIVRANEPFATKVEKITQGYCEKLKAYFGEVCEHPIRAKWDDEVPKYSLIFASRSPDALILMNRATITSRNIQANEAMPNDDTLWDLRPKSLVPDVSQLPKTVLDALDTRMTRKALVIKVIRSMFCQFTESQINAEIKALLKSGRVRSATGRAEINDSVEIWRT